MKVDDERLGSCNKLIFFYIEKTEKNEDPTDDSSLQQKNPTVPPLSEVFSHHS